MFSCFSVYGAELQRLGIPLQCHQKMCSKKCRYVTVVCCLEISMVSRVFVDRFRGNARSLADIPGESDLDHMSGLMHSELFAANRRVIELESAVKHLRYMLNDLDLEVVNTRKNANRLESHPDDRLDDESQAYSSSASPPHTPPHRTLDRGDNSSTDHQ